MSFLHSLKTVDMPLVKLMVNGHEGFFLVDTGSNVCHIDESFAKEVGAEEIPPIVDYTTSVHGNAEVSHSYNVSFIIDGVRLDDIPCAAADFKAMNETLAEFGFGMNGISGMFLMRILHASIDVEKAEVALRIPDTVQRSES